jgi:hypothetical protein
MITIEMHEAGPKVRVDPGPVSLLDQRNAARAEAIAALEHADRMVDRAYQLEVERDIYKAENKKLRRYLFKLSITAGVVIFVHFALRYYGL